MKLYSIQPLAVYEHLADGRVWTAAPFAQPLTPQERDDLEETFRRPYDWLAAQMRMRGCLPVSEDTVYPVWAWYQWSGRLKAKPDLRHQALRDWAARGPQVMLTLEVPEHRVVVSDYDAWHFALNYWHLGAEAENAAFCQRCAAQGLSYYRHKPLPDATLHEALQGSWEAIFDPKRAAQLLESPLGESRLQATFWELRPEDVRSVVQFSQRGKSAPLAWPVS